jgi:hypothetical protein
MHLRGLVILALLVAILVFMLPFVVGFILFVILAVGIFMLLARMGLLPGFVFKTYRFPSGERASSGTESRAEGDRAGVWPEPEGHRRNGWYQDDQEGEVITLPETALKKDGDEGK